MKTKRKQPQDIDLIDDIIKLINSTRERVRYLKVIVSINGKIKDIYIPLNLTKSKTKRIFLKNHILSFFVAECISILKLNKRNYKYVQLTSETFNSSIIEEDE